MWSAGVLFFKQKTAYEMRISDWSSDVCSSDLATFGKGPHDSFQCDIVAHVMQGLVLKGHGQAQDAHVAFEGAAERIEKQLRRYMRRLKDHNNGIAAPSPTVDEIADNAEIGRAHV